MASGKAIHSELAPLALGPYSQAVKLDGLVFISGQIPLDPSTMELVSGDVGAQAEQVLENLQAIAAAAGGSLDHIVKLTIYMTDLAHFGTVNEVMEDFFREPYPARATVQVAGLPKEAAVEIEAIMSL